MPVTKKIKKKGKKMFDEDFHVECVAKCLAKFPSSGNKIQAIKFLRDLTWQTISIKTAENMINRMIFR